MEEAVGWFFGEIREKVWDEKNFLGMVEHKMLSVIVHTLDYLQSW